MVTYTMSLKYIKEDKNMKKWNTPVIEEANLSATAHDPNGRGEYDNWQQDENQKWFLPSEERS